MNAVCRSERSLASLACKLQVRATQLKFCSLVRMEFICVASGDGSSWTNISVQVSPTAATTGVSVQTRFLCCVSENKTQAGDMADVDRSSGGAKRRRERRLRSWWRHERMSVAAALTAFRRVGGQKRTKPYGDRRPSVHRWSRSSWSCLTKSPAGRGLTASLASGRRNGSSDTPWSTSSTVRRSCRLSMLLCR